MQNAPPWVDSHCHLEMLKTGLDQALQAVSQAGMPFCISIGTGKTANRRVTELVDQYDCVFGTVGLHPHYASSYRVEELDWMRTIIGNNPRIVAVGECGFDFYYNRSGREDQKTAFAAQLELAAETGVPVVIHSRDADAETRDMLEAYRGKQLRGVVHCFTSDIDQARYLLDMGFYLSFNGISTYRQAELVREVLAFVPLDRMLLETDAPYLTPEPLRGKPNVPANVAIVGRFVSDFLDLPPGDVAETILANTRTLFNRIDYEH